MSKKQIAEVALVGFSQKILCYQIPTSWDENLQVGALVRVPLQQNIVEGVVVGLREKNENKSLREISSLWQKKGLPLDLLHTLQFVSQYYFASLGDVLRVALPVGAAKECERVGLTSAGKETIKKILEKQKIGITLSWLEEDILHALEHMRNQEGLVSALRKRISVPPKKAEWIQAINRLQELDLLEEKESRSHRFFAVITATEEAEKIARVLEKKAPKQALWLRTIVEEKQVSKQKIPGHVLRRLLEKNCVVVQWIEENTSVVTEKKFVPTAEQEQILKVLQEALARCIAANEKNHSEAYLLQGVTGSGKTEVYLQLIEQALAAGRTAVVLVPEIALTPQLAARFGARFGDKVGVLHSGLSAKDRMQCWEGFLEGRLQIAVGARSALFAPLSNVGVIVVDEEHDPSFKQQDGVRYHARDVALVRGQSAGAVVVLGSATPSMEALGIVESGKAKKLILTKRAMQQPLPAVEVINLRQHVGVWDEGLISVPLAQAIAETLERQEQVLLFLNRRGYATYVFCQSCGQRFECKNCAVALTWHKEKARLLCHYCNEEVPEDTACMSCQGTQIAKVGVGTQKIVEHITKQFPQARVGRLDRDTTGDLHRVLQDMHTGNIDVLIGTQMLAKGHDFQNVTLVGVVLADTGIHLPDFRASERTFQLLAQVSGRAGRSHKPGRVIVQTFVPNHSAILWACAHDTDAFAKEELQLRKSQFYPPFSRMAAVRLDGHLARAVEQQSHVVGRYIKSWIAKQPRGERIDVLGPAPAPLSKLKGQIRYQLFVRAIQVKQLHTLMKQLMEEESLHTKEVRMQIDIDPGSML